MILDFFILFNAKYKRKPYKSYVLTFLASNDNRDAISVIKK